MLMKEEKNIN